MEHLTETKNISGERWQEFCETYTNGNRGRVVSITIVSEDASELLAKGVVFSAIDYAPVGKDDDFVISYGDQASLASHVVYVPFELWQAKDQR
jgi:hypothetical protein